MFDRRNTSYYAFSKPSVFPIEKYSPLYERLTGRKTLKGKIKSRLELVDIENKKVEFTLIESVTRAFKKQEKRELDAMNNYYKVEDEPLLIQEKEDVYQVFCLKKKNVRRKLDLL